MLGEILGGHVDFNTIFYVTVVVSLFLIIVNMYFILRSRVRERWYLGKPYLPESYLLAQIMDPDNLRSYVDSLAAALYKLIVEGYLEVTVSKKKAVMGNVTKLTFSKIKDPEGGALKFVYDMLPSNIRKHGLFGGEESNNFDADDLYTYFMENKDEEVLDRYRDVVRTEYEKKYGAVKINFKPVGFLLGAIGTISAIWSIYLGYAYSNVSLSYVLYILGGILIAVSISVAKIKFLWSSKASKFRSRWLGFKKSVLKGDIDVDDFYDLLGYALALGIGDRYLDVVKKLIVDGKVKLERVIFLKGEDVSYADLRALVRSIVMVVGGIGGKVASGDKEDRV